MLKPTIITRSKNEEAPFSETQLLEIIDQNSKLTPQDLVSELANKLTEISSKHKFIIQYTLLKANDVAFDLNISTDFVASWEPSKDGCINIRLDLEKEVGGDLNDGAKEKDEGSSNEDDDDVPKNSSEETDSSLTTETTTNQNQLNSLLLTVYWISI